MKNLIAPGGIPTFVSLHENEVYENLLEKTCKHHLNERDTHLMQSLVNKGLVNKRIIKRVIENKKVYFMRRSVN